jgi:carboxyl-terminal processing protease
MEGKDIVVISPLDGSPAERAGVKAGDKILKVNGSVTTGWSLAQAVEKIRGEKGTDVTVTVSHKDSSKEVSIKITRDTITVKSVEMNVRNAKCTQTSCQIVAKGDACNEKGCNSFAFIRLSQFGDNTNQEWVGMVKGLSGKIKRDKNIKGVVFDLRNNPGGYLTDASFIASEFLTKEQVVVIEDDGNQQNPMTVVREGLLTEPKIVILINKGSASASEIVAGALQDHNRAVLVGETSYGKGTIQEAEDLGDGAGLHVTIAKWLTPNGTWVNGKGLTPDVKVSLDSKKPTVDVQLEKAVFELIK